MSGITADIVPEDGGGFVPRGAEVAQERAVFADARSFERERRLRHLVTVGGGWVFGTVMGAVAVACLGVMWHRPVPVPKLGVSFIHDNGVMEPPVLREDLPKGRFDVLLVNSARQYLIAREAYSWEGIARAYNTVSVMSAPAEQARYQAIMDPRNKDPENPRLLYGDTPSSAKVDVVAVKINLDPLTNNALTADFVAKVMAPGQPARFVRSQARMTWTPAEAVIPLEMQEAYDPAAIQFTSYSHNVNPEPGR